MSTDDFEKTLRRQPLRQVPKEWRTEILRNAVFAPNSSCVIRHSFLSTLNSKLSALLWPNPKAWAGLAAVWIAIMAAQLASGDPSSKVEKKAESSSPQTLIALRQQQELLAQLIGQSPSTDADRPKRILQQPRSERRMTTLLA